MTSVITATLLLLGFFEAVDPGAQRVAQQRANYMATHRYFGHPAPGLTENWRRVPGATFEGVGWMPGKINKHRISTCRPSGQQSPSEDNSRVLLADAVAYANGHSFRVRIWGNHARTFAQSSR